MSHNPFAVDAPHEDPDVPEETIDNLEIPPGEDIDFEAAAETIQKLNTSGPDAPAETPTTPRPGAGQRMASSDNLTTSDEADAGSYEDADEGTPREETQNDPDEDIMSLNTDINQHRREIDSLRAEMRAIAKQLQIIPDLDSKLRRLLATNDENLAHIAELKGDMANVKQSFNRYQTATSNKIADVERRGFLKQLAADPKPEESVIPPEHVSMIRDPVVPMNRQVDTIPSAAVSGKQQKKLTVAVVPDW